MISLFESLSRYSVINPLACCNRVCAFIGRTVRQLCPAKPTSTTSENVLKRSHQIGLATIETAPLSRDERLKLAHFVEEKLPTLVENKVTIFPKTTFNIPRTIQYSSEEGGTIFIVAKHKKSIPKLRAEGTFKRISACAKMSLSSRKQAPEVFARAVTKSIIDGYEPGEEEIEDAKKEIARTNDIVKAIRKANPNAPLGIVPFIAISTFTSYNKVSKISMICPAFDGTFTQLINKNAGLTLGNFKSLAIGIARGLLQLHKLNYIHGDVHSENCVYNVNPKTRKIEDARLIDLGHAFHLKKEKPSFIYDTGFYGGGGKETPPEMFGKTPFKGDFKKVDIFGLGFTLFMLYFKKMPSWADDITHQYELYYESKKQSKRWLKCAQKTVLQKMEREIEAPLQKLQKKSMPTAQDKIRSLIYQTLRIDPDDRISLPTFLRALNNLPT